MRDRIVSVQEAARLRGITREGVMKAIQTGRLASHLLSGKGYLLSERQVLGKKFDEAEFRRLCRLYVSVPEACNICWKTDAAIMRDLRRGTIVGFKVNAKCWAVLRSSAEEEFRDYLESHKGRAGRKRDIGTSRSPRDIRKKPLKKK
jgi:hypothetical protein